MSAPSKSDTKRLLFSIGILPISLALALLAISLWEANYLDSVHQWIDHSDQALKRGHLLRAYATAAQSEFLGYRFSGIQSLSDLFKQNVDAFTVGYGDLRVFISDNPAQIQRLDDCNHTFREWLNFVNGPPIRDARKLYEAERGYGEKTDRACEYFMQGERDLRSARSQWMRSSALSFSAAIGLITFLSVALFAVFGRNAVVRMASGFKSSIDQRDEFISVASHELRTPLTSLKLQLQLSKRWLDSSAPTKGDKVAKAVEVCGNQVNRLQALIDDLLDVTRISARKLRYKFENVDLVEVVRDVVEQFNENSIEPGRHLNLKAPKTFVVYCDRSRMEQVLTNLLSNAEKYGLGKPIEVSLLDEGDRARILVRDQGVGIPKDQQARIFERFERAESADHVAGLGLGLYIAREIIHGHEGTIHVESDEGRGATFVVEIPRQARILNAR